MYGTCCRAIVALCVCTMHVHNAHAPIVIKLDGFLQPFVIEALGLSKWIVGACLYLSACGKYLQLSMYGATRLH